MSDMTEGEALERIREGLKKAASAARDWHEAVATAREYGGELTGVFRRIADHE